MFNYVLNYIRTDREFCPADVKEHDKKLFELEINFWRLGLNQQGINEENQEEIRSENNSEILDKKGKMIELEDSDKIEDQSK